VGPTGRWPGGGAKIFRIIGRYTTRDVVTTESINPAVSRVRLFSGYAGRRISWGSPASETVLFVGHASCSVRRKPPGYNHNDVKSILQPTAKPPNKPTNKPTKMKNSTGARRISLASGVLPEFDAVTVALAAVAAGYSDAGLMVRPGQWRPDDERRLLDIRDEHGLGLLDVEVLWIPKGGTLDQGHDLIVDVAGRLNADHLLVVSDEADPDVLAPALRHISARCQPTGVRPMLEFLRITEVTSLHQTREILDATTGHHFGILLDALHLARSEELRQLPPLDPRQHPYIQLCDGAEVCAPDRPSLLEDAIDYRCAPGQGELDLVALLGALPADTPISLEVRSKALREAFPDPNARAAALLNQTQSFLQETQHDRP